MEVVRIKYDIYVANYTDDGQLGDILRIPVLPEKMPELTRASNNDTFETYNDGYYPLLGNVELVTFTLESFFPAVGKNYPFQKEKEAPATYIKFFSNAQRNKKPIRYVFGGSDGYAIVDDYFTVESFKWYIDKMQDVQYSIDFKQYREVS
ncbi:hypothetical protein AGR56_09135 [Clostridium sp. DMHC 10]|uniref:hypothetical protein n=1 Tax=Clostridium sp. DMHC 10 TaxID=747377 RepID=UPI00069E4576|nr:hypothetical protein [Clostridium sp. DMHC 10]KOF56816.1 hypothetical protein AGR56_09135 [Clostridium sp. DMHC 10]